MSTKLGKTLALLMIGLLGVVSSLAPIASDPGAEGRQQAVSTVVYIDPHSIKTGVQVPFTIGVIVANVTDLYAWQIKIYYNPSVLNWTGAWYPEGHVFDGREFIPLAPISDTDANGTYMMFAASLIGYAPGFNGTGTLCQIGFNALTLGVSSLEFSRPIPDDTVLYDSNIDLIAFSVIDATVEVVKTHDVAVTSIQLSSTAVAQGFPVYVNVTVENQGEFSETFNLTVRADTVIIGTQIINATSHSSTVIAFTWNTTNVAFGNYTIEAEASVVPDEIDTADNSLIDGSVQIGPSFHDVTVIGVGFSSSFAYSGENVSIYVDVWNQGYFPETFNVTAYADENTSTIGDEITIGTQSVALPSKHSMTLTFTWNTTGVPPSNYTISAFASNVTQEADPTDNFYADGRIGIFISVPCHNINITSPTYIELNPSIFQFNWTVRALEVSLGNMTIDSTGHEGFLRILGSTNGTVHLRVDQPDLEFVEYYLPQNGTIKVPLWLLLDPGTYSGIYELQLAVCGIHRLKITINIVHIWVCQNGAYSVSGGTVMFNWTVTGGSWVYLQAETQLPTGWSFTVDPSIGTLFETPHAIIVNITVAPDAKEGDIGSVALRVFKNGTDIMIWQFTYFASVDNNPPTIEAVQPPVLTLSGDLLFNVTVKDTSGIEDVQLYYSIDDGPWNNQTMQWDSGDTFNPTTYTLTIPHVPENSSIQYYVLATDWLGNQTQSDNRTITTKYDLAVTEVKPGRTVVGQGFATQINITIANQGTTPSTSLKIAVYTNTSLIHTQTIPFLTNGTATTLTLHWNTTNLPKGKYKITAFVVPILGETDTADNTYTDVEVTVAMIGDITGPTPDVPDGKIDIRDIAAIARHFGCQRGDTCYMANYDVTGTVRGQPDGKIDIRDIALAASQFGQIDP